MLYNSIMKKIGLIIGSVVLVGVLAGAFWFWSQKGADVAKKASPTAAGEAPVATEVPEIPAAIETKDGLGAEAFNKTNNPLSNELPETNPFEVNTNPFK